MPKNAAVTLYDDRGFPSVAKLTAAVPANGTANTIVKASPGHLHRLVVTVAPTTTTGTTTIFDSAAAASGLALVTIQNNLAVGSIVVPDQPALNGIVVTGSANCPGLTVGYA